MDFITIITIFSQISKGADTLIIPHKSYFILSALSILLHDLYLSDDPFPYKANNPEWDESIAQLFILKKVSLFINLLIIK